MGWVLPSLHPTPGAARCKQSKQSPASVLRAWTPSTLRLQPPSPGHQSIENWEAAHKMPPWSCEASFPINLHRAANGLAVSSGSDRGWSMSTSCHCCFFDCRALSGSGGGLSRVGLCSLCQMDLCVPKISMMPASGVVGLFVCGGQPKVTVCWCETACTTAQPKLAVERPCRTFLFAQAVDGA